MSNGLLQYEYFSSVTQHRKNELGIQKSFDELSQEKTSLVIAHRLSTIQQADQIIIMENGNILAIANSIDQHVRVRKIDKRELSAFNLEGYQVVRNQFTQVRYEGPSITISDDRITFNIFCMKKFSDVGYIQLLLHPTERKIAIRPCREKDTHSIRWRLDPEKPFYSKSLSCPHFGSALYCIMGWNPDYLYKIRGIWAKRFSEQIIVFNLSNGVPAVIVTNDGNITGAKRRVEMCPDEWTDDFGDEFYEHVLENGFYYLTSEADWQTAAPSIPAPGLEQYIVPTQKEVQLRIETIMRRDDNGNV